MERSANSINEEVLPLGHGDMMHKPVEEMTVPESIIYYATLNQLAKEIEKRLEEFKPGLKTYAQDHGKENDQGGFEAVVQGTQVIKERRRETAPQDEELRLMLHAHKIPLDECYVEVKALELSPSKLNFLVETGKLDKDEVEALHKITWACKVIPGPELKGAIKAALKPPEEKSAKGEKVAKKASKKAAS